MTSLTVVYDACVLYPFSLRDILIQLAADGLFRARWTSTINEEWTRNLLRNQPSAVPEKWARTVSLMNQAVRDALVEDYEGLIEGLELPDSGDRHVMAAAIKARASVIVTFNLKDFPKVALQPYALEAQRPDDFLLDIIDLEPRGAIASARKAWRRRGNPPVTWQTYLESLARSGIGASSRKLLELSEML